METIRRRVVALIVVSLVALGLIGCRLVTLQGLDRGRYAALGRDQRLRTVTLGAERGSIFDRYGNDLAVSVPQQTVWADPRVVDDAEQHATLLAPILGVDATGLREVLDQPDRAFVYLARQVDDETAARVAALDLAGVGLLPESKRFYPSGSLAAPVLGFVGLDNQGLGGLEVAYDELLTGAPGTVVVERDPHGREIPRSDRELEPARRGDDLVLTIDQALQYHVEQVLTEQVGATGADGGMASVVDVTTGDVLAMATVQGADEAGPARPAAAESRNLPLEAVYEPGSTNKVITLAGAIEDGLVGPDTPFAVPWQLPIGDAVFEDSSEHPTATWSVTDIMRRSSNVGTIMIGDLLGRDRLDEYLRAFGFGQRTAIEFPGEAEGLLPSPAEYSDTSMGTVPIGNGLAVTAMQMLDVFATIANGGAMQAPRLVAATVDADGERHDQPRAAARPVVSASTADALTQMLVEVVRDGTGTQAAVPGYTVAGKTGTARKPPYLPGVYVASFAGFAPAESPRLAAIVVIDEPPQAYYGGTVAAPVFSEIMQYALRLERVPPSEAIGASGGAPAPPEADSLAPTTSPSE